MVPQARAGGGVLISTRSRWPRARNISASPNVGQSDGKLVSFVRRQRVGAFRSAHPQPRNGRNVPDVIPAPVVAGVDEQRRDPLWPREREWRTDNVRLPSRHAGREDKCLQGADIGFGVGIGKTPPTIISSSRRVITRRARFMLPADNPGADAARLGRQKGREYSVDEREGTLYIHTNDEHPFRVATARMKTGNGNADPRIGPPTSPACRSSATISSRGARTGSIRSMSAMTRR